MTTNSWRRVTAQLAVALAAITTPTTAWSWAEAIPAVPPTWRAYRLRDPHVIPRAGLRPGTSARADQGTRCGRDSLGRHFSVFIRPRTCAAGSRRGSSARPSGWAASRTRAGAANDGSPSGPTWRSPRARRGRRAPRLRQGHPRSTSRREAEETGRGCRREGRPRRRREDGGLPARPARGLGHDLPQLPLGHRHRGRDEPAAGRGREDPASRRAGGEHRQADAPESTASSTTPTRSGMASRSSRGRARTSTGSASGCCRSSGCSTQRAGFADDGEGNPVGTWDEGRLEQVVQNLVGNALRYGAADAPVLVRWSRDGDPVGGRPRTDRPQRGAPDPFRPPAARLRAVPVGTAPARARRAQHGPRPLHRGARCVGARRRRGGALGRRARDHVHRAPSGRIRASDPGREGGACGARVRAAAPWCAARLARVAAALAPCYIPLSGVVRAYASVCRVGAAEESPGTAGQGAG